LQGVAQPLRELHQELTELKGLLATILFAIVVAAIAVAIGTPIAAVLIYKHRHKLFKNMNDGESQSVERKTLSRV
jgi:ABC-type spermidine/putrescine transport system permease subunit I